MTYPNYMEESIRRIAESRNDSIRNYTDEQLFTEVLRRGYDEHDAYGAIVQLVENHCARSDEIWGSSEAGLHGKAMGEAKSIKQAEKQQAIYDKEQVARKVREMKEYL